MTTVLRTDTAAIPAAEPDTTAAIPAPWVRPPVATTYRQPNVLDDLAAWWRASSLAESARSAFWPLALGCGVIVGVLVAAR